MYSIRLRELREEKNLTLQSLSKLLGFEKDTYGKYEREYTTFPIKHLNTICNYFDVSFDYIFGFSENKKYDNYVKELDMEKISVRLKEVRKDYKVSQVELAKILNVVKGTVGNYESKRSLIATAFLYEICNRFGVSADYLLGKIDEPKYLK